MGFLESYKRLLRVAVKPSKEDFWLSMKICLAGVGLIGAIAYLIRIVASVLLGA